MLAICESENHDKPDENWGLHDDVSNLNSFVYLLISHYTVKVVTFVSKQKVCKDLMYFLAVHWTPGHYLMTLISQKFNYFLKYNNKLNRSFKFLSAKQTCRS